MKVLMINSHPDYEGEHSTNELLKYAAGIVKEDVTIKNIYDVNENVRPLTKDMIDMWMGVDKENKEHELMRKQQNEIVEEWIDADVVFIFSPLHNLGITSKLKDYFDNILQANRTFKYTVDGPVGLLDNSKKVIYVQVSGSTYTEDINYIHLDLAPQYMRTLLNFMGISKMELIRAQGMNLDGADAAKILADAKEEIQTIVDQL